MTNCYHYFYKNLAIFVKGDNPDLISRVNLFFKDNSEVEKHLIQSQPLSKNLSYLQLIEKSLTTNLELDDLKLLDLSSCSPFQLNTLINTVQIKRGNVASYARIALNIHGKKRAAQTVGKIMSQNKYPLIIPCHRVVYATGKLGSYSYGGLEMKKYLLSLEGFKVKD